MCEDTWWLDNYWLLASIQSIVRQHHKVRASLVTSQPPTVPLTFYFYPSRLYWVVQLKSYNSSFLNDATNKKFKLETLPELL